MKLSLLQPVQNRLYDFKDKYASFARQDAIGLQEEMIAQTMALLDQAGRSDLVVTTEAINFAGPYDRLDGDYGEVIARSQADILGRCSGWARSHRAWLALGMLQVRDGKIYNTAQVFNREGDLIACYDKVHLAGGEQQVLTAGREYTVVETDFGRFAPCVCWDMQFPEVSRELVLRGAELIVCPTWGWEQIYAHARAYENGVFVAGAMSVPYQMPIEGLRNPSEVISPEGVVVAAGPRDRAGVVQCDITLADCQPYRAMRMGDRRPDTYTTVAQREGNR